MEKFNYPLLKLGYPKLELIKEDIHLFTRGKKGFRQDAYLDSFRDLELDINTPFYNAAKKFALQNDITEKFYNSLEDRISEEKNISLCVSGFGRTGKSIGAQGIYFLIHQIQTQYKIKNALSIKDIIWSEEQLIYGRKEYLEYGRTLITDEDYRNKSGLGITSINEAIDTLTNELGISGINLLYVGVETQQPNVLYQLEAESYDRKTFINKFLCLRNGLPFAHIRIRGRCLFGYEKAKHEHISKIIHNENRQNNKYISILTKKVTDKLGENIQLYSNEALKGKIRVILENESLQENQLWAVFQECLAYKTDAKISNPNLLKKLKLKIETEELQSELKDL